MSFKKATKAAAKLRLGLIGPAGSGKTMTALRVAHGLGGRVAVIDTERGSASLYSGERGMDFDVLELESYEVDRFTQAIKEAGSAGYSTLIIDSLSHAWSGKGGILELVDNAGKRTQGGGGNFGAWREATPQHNKLVDAILGAPMHIICTLRSKVEYVVETVGGRTQVRKVGLQPVQRDGLEYEFTVVGDVTQDHDLVVTKTRAAFLTDAVIRNAGEDLGKQLAAWLSDGIPAPVTTAPSSAKAAPAAQGTAPVEAKLGWLDRVNQAATVDELGTIGDEADEAVSAGDLSPTQRLRLDKQIAIRHQQIEPEVAGNAVA